MSKKLYRVKLTEAERIELNEREKCLPLYLVGDTLVRNQ